MVPNAKNVRESADQCFEVMCLNGCNEEIALLFVEALRAQGTFDVAEPPEGTSEMGIDSFHRFWNRADRFIKDLRNLNGPREAELEKLFSKLETMIKTPDGPSKLMNSLGLMGEGMRTPAGDEMTALLRQISKT
jgi:hypothetical protein